MAQGQSWDSLRGLVRQTMVSSLAEVGLSDDTVAVLTSSGRCNRGALYVAIGSVNGKRPPVADLAVAAGVELIHRSSVIRDDIQDEDVVRRGQPTVHASLGPTRALALSDIMLTSGLRLVSRHSAWAQGVMVDAIAQMALGQFMDINGPLPGSASSAFAIAELKTGALVGAIFEIAAVTGGRVSGAHVDTLRKCGIDLGTGFQLLNDVRNIVSDEARGRPPGSDLATGRYSSIALVLQQGAAEPGPQQLDQAVAFVRAEAHGRLARVRERVVPLQGIVPSRLFALISSDELAQAFVADQQFAASVAEGGVANGA